MTILSELPEDAVKINNIFELVVINPNYPDKHKPKYWGKLYIKSALGESYEEYNFDDNVTSEKIKKYIATNQLYFVEKI